ncbi:MAG: hypothetical protein KAS58_06405 [Calditrichia bacterium]|nr:hypothetical protein [Calditrichia bacterium]
MGCSEKKKVEKDSKTKAGIQTLKSDTKYYSGLMIDETDLLRDYVHKAIEGAAQGISLFSLNALSNEHLKILTMYGLEC